MSPEGIAAGSIIDDVVAIRSRWHTKHHPMFTDLAAGRLDLRVLGVYMAQHAKFVKLAYEAFGLMIVRASLIRLNCSSF